MSLNHLKKWLNENFTRQAHPNAKDAACRKASGENSRGNGADDDEDDQKPVERALSSEYVRDEYDRLQADLFGTDPETTILQFQRSKDEQEHGAPRAQPPMQSGALFTSQEIVFDPQGSIFEDNSSLLDADEQPYILELKMEDWYAIQCGRKRVTDFDEKNMYLSLKRGIPDDMRRFVWRAVSDIDTLKGEFWQYRYKDLRSRRSYAEAQILLDVPRTNIRGCEEYFRQQSTQDKLRNILVAYSNLNRELGYTQGMNFIVAVLLQHLDRSNCSFVSEEHVQRVLDDDDELEEDIFWIFVRMMEKLDLKFHFMDGFPGTFRAFRILEQRMRSKIPDILKKIEDVGREMMIDLTDTFQFFFFSYFTSLMIYKTPKDFSKRILDLYLYVGEDVIISTIIKMLQFRRTQLLAMNEQEFKMYFQQQIIQEFQMDLSHEHAVDLTTSELKVLPSNQGGCK